MSEQCDVEFLWWDGDNEGTFACHLGSGHSGAHFDGRRYFDENGDRVDCRCGHPTGCAAHLGTLPFRPPFEVIRA